jgi:lipid-binding SYLF domain-containing protein
MLRIFLALSLLITAVIPARANEALERAETARAVLSNVMYMPENRIPFQLLERAEAIAVIPGVIKAGFIIGGQRGKGLLSVRQADGSWSLPVYLKFAGGSVGFQAGVQSTDVVLVFTAERSINRILDGTFTLGADAAVAAGPVGRQTGASTDHRLDAEIYSYSRSRGLFAGISLDGSVMDIDLEATRTAYGDQAAPRRVLAGEVTQRPDAVIDFADMLEELSAVAWQQSQQSDE